MLAGAIAVVSSIVLSLRQRVQGLETENKLLRTQLESLTRDNERLRARLSTLGERIRKPDEDSGLWFVENRLRQVLMRCAALNSDNSLKAIFVDARLHPFRERLSDCESHYDRVNMVSSLRQYWSTNGDNLLVLVLRVLAEQTPSGDACHNELVKMAELLEEMLV